MASAVSDVTFNLPEEFFIHCAKNGLLPRIFDHTQVDALVAEYKIDPAWIDDIHANAIAYFEAYLIETDQIDTIMAYNEDAIEHIIMCTEVPQFAHSWILQLQEVRFQDDLADLDEEKALDEADDCYYGMRCTKRNCRFTHHIRPSAPAASTTRPSAPTDCYFGIRCTKRDCRFTHPSAPAAPAAPTTRPSAPAASTTHPSAPAAPTAPIACYFQNSCTKRDCTYTHPGVPCNGRLCMHLSNCFKQGKSCPFHHPGDTCQH